MCHPSDMKSRVNFSVTDTHHAAIIGWMISMADRPVDDARCGINPQRTLILERHPERLKAGREPNAGLYWTRNTTPISQIQYS
jgi:hypothetical protein